MNRRHAAVRRTPEKGCEVKIAAGDGDLCGHMCAATVVVAVRRSSQGPNRRVGAFSAPYRVAVKTGGAVKVMLSRPSFLARSDSRQGYQELGSVVDEDPSSAVQDSYRVLNEGDKQAGATPRR